MSEFLLVFRMDIINEEAQPTLAQMGIYMQKWGEWINKLSEQDKLLGGNHLSTEGRVLRSNNVVTEGPYTENNESIAGYILIEAEDFDEAVNLAKACPILEGEGTCVEVRKIASI